MTPAGFDPCICGGSCQTVVATCLDHATAEPLPYAQVRDFEREHPTCVVIVVHDRVTP